MNNLKILFNFSAFTTVNIFFTSLNAILIMSFGLFFIKFFFPNYFLIESCLFLSFLSMHDFFFPLSQCAINEQYKTTRSTLHLIRLDFVVLVFIFFVFQVDFLIPGCWLLTVNPCSDICRSFPHQSLRFNVDILPEQILLSTSGIILQPLPLPKLN